MSSARPERRTARFFELLFFIGLFLVVVFVLCLFCLLFCLVFFVFVCCFWFLVCLFVYFVLQFVLGREMRAHGADRTEQGGGRPSWRRGAARTRGAALVVLILGKSLHELDRSYFSSQVALDPLTRLHQLVGLYRSFCRVNPLPHRDPGSSYAHPRI